ncbi:glycosyltransferase family 39 protein, partial [Patescibacteria group bacterium]|nr:glycosyltransferase family 39 protein [Patescibacteria group bacterium]
MKKRFVYILLVLILIAGFILRSYNLKNSFSFSGEFGDNLLDIKNAVILKTIPLTGPPVSHPWLKFGPMYYWIMIPLMLVFKFDVLVGAWFGVLGGTSIILINYFVIKKVFNEKIALVSSFLISFSPLWISFSRDARFFFFTTLVFYFFLYSLWNFYENKKGLFILGFCYSLFFHFHYSPILLFPILAYFVFLKRKSLKIKDYFNLLAGLFVPFVPLLIYDFKNNFQMFYKLILWVPYRFAGFIGLYPKNNLTYETLNQSLIATTEFIGKSFTYKSSFWFYVLVIFLIIYIFSSYKYIKSKKFEFGYSFIYLSLLVGVFGIIIHGDVPVHYYLPVFSIPIIIFSAFFVKVFQRNNSFIKSILSGVIVLMLYINISYFINYYRSFDESTFSIEPNFVSLELQKQVSNYIVNDSEGKNYSLVRVGPNDQFEEYYSQNYKYLLWLYGTEPIENSSL